MSRSRIRQYNDKSFMTPGELDDKPRRRKSPQDDQFSAFNIARNAEADPSVFSAAIVNDIPSQISHSCASPKTANARADNIFNQDYFRSENESNYNLIDPAKMKEIRTYTANELFKCNKKTQNLYKEF